MKSLKLKKQQPCHSGDLLVAEMDAKFGGYGIIPPELDGAIVTAAIIMSIELILRFYLSNISKP